MNGTDPGAVIGVMSFMNEDTELWGTNGKGARLRRNQPDKGKRRSEETTWSMGESIMFEMDMVLSMLSGYMNPSFFEDTESLYRAVPSELRDDLRQFLPGPKYFINIFARVSHLFDQLNETDFKKASLNIRKVSISQILEKQLQIYAPYSIYPDKTLADSEQLRDLILKGFLAGDEMYKFDMLAATEQMQVAANVDFMKKIFRNGESEYEFWHAMDRFYYEVYHPWRKKYAPDIEKRKEAALKKIADSGRRESVKWLASMHPIVNRPEVRRSLTTLKSGIHIVVTPFRYSDVCHIEPGFFLFTLTESAWRHEQFAKNIQEIAALARAVSDPTRLSILRGIREIGQYTTELAVLMNLSRPTVSEHCRILRQAGLIETYQKGRKSYHKLRPEKVRTLFRQLERFLDLPESD